MTDQFDRAADLEERARAAAIASRRKTAPAATGHCLFCGDDAPAGHRWCSKDCRDDWEHQHKQRALILRTGGSDDD